MTKHSVLIRVGALLAVLALAATAYGEDPKIPHVRYRLDNGLEVILVQDTRIPIVAVDVWYHVGSGDEEPKKSGFAHLFEHMMFQGSRHIGADQHFAILRNIGGTGVNGSTNTDRTNYFEVVPSNELESALWLESDRMGFLLASVTEESLKNQIEVVRNERRQSMETSAYGETLFESSKALYPEGHPYRHMVIGLHEDLANASLEDVKNFFRKWYAPANATLVVAGDFEVDNAKAAIQKWFGTLPSSKRPEHRAPFQPKQEKVRKKISDKFAKLERIDYVWHSPPVLHAGDAEMEMIGDILGRNGTGRLYTRLVVDEELAQTVTAFQWSRNLSSVFMLIVVAKSGADMKKIENVMQEEIEKVRKEPVTKEEFNRAVLGNEARVVWSLESLIERAELLQTYNHYAGDPDYITKDLDRYRKSSPARIRDIASRVLGQPRVEILTVPATEKAQ